MTDDQISTLDVHALTERLRSLAGEERNLQADFLLHLDALDRRRGYAELGYPSLWEYCLRALHLREGAAGRRIGAMRVLRRFPSLVGALRDGRLCLSTLCVLGPVLTLENVEEVSARAAFRTKAETDAIAAAVKPRAAPADGVRRIPAERPATTRTPSVEPGPAAVVHPALPPSQERELSTSGGARVVAEPAPLAATGGPVAARPGAGDILNGGIRSVEDVEVLRLDPPPRRASPSELRATAEAQWSLRVTLDSEAKRDLETLTRLLSHKVPDGNLVAVLKEALRCAIEKHGVRRGALTPARKRPASNGPPGDSAEGTKPSFASGCSSPDSAASAEPVPLAPGGARQQEERDRDRCEAGGPARTERLESPSVVSIIRARRSPGRPAIPAEVRRQVWSRDGGRCTFVAQDGTRCESRWKLELDHITSWALGGSSTAADLRLRCRAHNLFHAEEVFGREHMERFRHGGNDSLRGAARAGAGKGAKSMGARGS